MSRPTGITVAPVYEVRDLGDGAHERYLFGWDVVDSEGIYMDGPFLEKGEALEAAQAFAHWWSQKQ